MDGAASWLPVIVTIGINLIVVAFLFGGMRSKLDALQEDVKRLCGDHDGITLNTEKIKEHERKLEWGTRRFEEVFRAIYALARNEPVKFIGEPPP